MRLALALALLALVAPAAAAQGPRPSGLPAATAAALAASSTRLAAAEAHAAALRRTARRLQLRRLGRSPTVDAALRRALLTGAIDRAHAARYRSDLIRARATARRLGGTRGLELASVAALAERLAAAHGLTTTRLGLVFGTLEHNLAFWPRAPLPAAGQRLVAAGDPVVWRSLPGQGLQVHMLASWGRVNGMASACLGHRRDCRPIALRRALRTMLALGSTRGGFEAWESPYDFGGVRGPWVSAMTQGTAIQALARAATALHERRWLIPARAALGAFARRPPVGVAVPGGGAHGGLRFLMYSGDPGQDVLNGWLQAVTGLHDLAVLSDSHRARALYRSGERAARDAVGAFDTGAWSLYALGGHETDLGYHELTRGFLANLCRRTHRRVWCLEARRYARYEREPPRLVLLGTRHAHARRATAVTLELSKVSDVRVRIAGPTGVLLDVVQRLPRGRHRWPWTPPRPGHYRVAIAARGLSGPRGTAQAVVRAAGRRPHHRHDRGAAGRG